MTNSKAEIAAEANALLDEIGLTPAFLAELEKDTDWSFLIKLHALVEGGMTHALSDTLGKEGAREIFARLELSNDKTGKLAFSKVLLNLDKDDRRFISKFSEFRNKLVHDVRNLNFSLAAHFGAMPLKDQRDFVRNLGYRFEESDGEIDEVIARGPQTLRALILNSTMIILAFLNLSIGLTRAERDAIKAKLEAHEYWHGSMFGKPARLDNLLSLATKFVEGAKSHPAEEGKGPS